MIIAWVMSSRLTWRACTAAFAPAPPGACAPGVLVTANIATRGTARRAIERMEYPF
jgi:hypothetical protein